MADSNLGPNPGSFDPMQAARVAAAAGHVYISETFQNLRDTAATDGTVIRPDGDRERRAMSVVDGILQTLTQSSKAKQLTAGGLGGWLCGFFTSKFGKAFLYLAGGSVVVIAIAERQGYITVDWERVKTRYGRLEGQVRSLARQNQQRSVRSLIEKAQILAQSSPFLVGGFVGGVLLGIVSA